MGFLITGTVIVSVLESDVEFMRVLYETTSAMGTVGLSADLTPQLETASKYVIMMLMYIGRIGPVTMALIFGKGYDHNCVLRNNGMFAKVAEMSGKDSGISMEVYTDLPGMQLYTANFVEDEKGKGGNIYQIRHAACFETQYYPDAIHKEQFPSPICRKGETYETCTMYKFIVK